MMKTEGERRGLNQPLKGSESREMTNTATQLQAGAGRADITPEMGIQLAGDIGRLRPTEEIREPVYANALVVEKNGRRLCLLSLDLLATTCEWADRLRDEACDRFGFQREEIMLHVTQNHATPSLGHAFLPGPRTHFPPEYPWLMGGDDRYNEPTEERCMQAIEEALGKLTPVSVQAGHGIDGRIAFNRRFVMRDGTALCHPQACDPNILHVEGPTDPEVAAVTFEDDRGQVIASLLHHTCHPCAGYPHRYVIGDWPGMWAARMIEHWGDQCVPLVVNGCCGNIHSRDHINPDPEPDHIRRAEMLTQSTLGLLGRMKEVSVDAIDLRHQVLPLEMRTLPQEEIDAATELLAEHPEPMWLDDSKTSVHWDWVYAIGVLDLQWAMEDQPEFPYEIQAFRLGDLSLLGIMGEPFVEGQLDIKRMAPTEHTLVAHFCNGYVGYVPTKKAFEGGGFETRTGCGSKLYQGALEEITATATSMLHELHGA